MTTATPPVKHYRIFRETYQRGIPSRIYYCGWLVPTSSNPDDAWPYDNLALARSAANRLTGGWQVEEVQL